MRYNANLPAKIQCFASADGKSHWHKEIELIYVAEGVLEVSKHGRKFSLAEDDVFLVNSGEIHQLSAAQPVRYLCLHLSYDFAKQFDAQLDAVNFEIAAQSAAEAELKSLLKDLAGRQDLDNQTFKQYAIIMDIFHVLFTHCRRQKRVSLYGNAKLGFRNAKVAIEYIEHHYRESLSLNIVAQQVGLHPMYFSKYFKDVTGTGFNTYVNSVRMRHALDDLTNLGLSIADAAKANGFPNVKSFETICKRSYGVTPLQFKKQRLKVS